MCPNRTDNALKFTPPGGEVTVRIGFDSTDPNTSALPPQQGALRGGAPPTADSNAAAAATASEHTEAWEGAADAGAAGPPEASGKRPPAWEAAAVTAGAGAGAEAAVAGKPQQGMQRSASLGRLDGGLCGPGGGTSMRRADSCGLFKAATPATPSATVPQLRTRPSEYSTERLSTAGDVDYELERSMSWNLLYDGDNKARETGPRECLLLNAALR